MRRSRLDGVVAAAMSTSNESPSSQNPPCNLRAPVSANISFKDALHVFEALGAEIDYKSGRRVGVKRCVQPCPT
jgi:hypothetical protein